MPSRALTLPRLLAAGAALILAGSSCQSKASRTGGVPPPRGWIRAGQNPDAYEMGVDPRGGRSGRPCGYIAATPGARTFGTLMQTFDAEDSRGKRLRLSAWVKSYGVAGSVGLWMRIDGPTAGRSPELLAFDNMQDRPITGTTDWKRYDVVLDVPAEAATVNFGILMTGGEGKAWLDDVKIEAVGPEVGVTGRGSLPKRPTNLDFAEG